MDSARISQVSAPLQLTINLYMLHLSHKQSLQWQFATAVCIQQACAVKNSTVHYTIFACARAQAELGSVVAAAAAELGGWDAGHRARAAALLRAALVCAEEAAARHAHLLVPSLCQARRHVFPNLNMYTAR